MIIPANAGEGHTESPISKLSGGVACPRTPLKFVPSALTFPPTALTSFCFTHASGTLKCYRKP